MYHERTQIMVENSEALFSAPNQAILINTIHYWFSEYTLTKDLYHTKVSEPLLNMKGITHAQEHTTIITLWSTP